MSSWGSYTPPPRLGYYQELPLGTFIKKEKPATVVSAYYQLRTKKWTNNQYKVWIEQFLSLPTFLVFFTSKDLEPWILSCRSKYLEKTVIIVLPEEEWTSTTNFLTNFWQEQHRLDPEKNLHSPELYKVWYEKKEFVKRAIELNPWNHTDFVWTDAGICREALLIPFLQHFPVADRIPTDRILMNNTSPFTRRDETQLISKKERIGAGIYAASIPIWNWFIKEYDIVLQKYITQNMFCGKEQDILSTLVLLNKEKISLLDVKSITINKWFYLFHYLGANARLFQIFRNPKLYKTTKTIQDYINISNNIE